MNRMSQRILVMLVVLSLAAMLTFLLWPAPEAVEVGVVEAGPLRITVDEDGRTRIKERYVVSAPLAGKLARVTLREGDMVLAGETVLASIEPADPSLLDPRERAAATARVHAAEAASLRAEAARSRAATAYELAQAELARLRDAQRQGAAAELELTRAASEASMRREDDRAAGFEQEIARFELDLARTALMRATASSEDTLWRLEILAPISGRVLRVMQESSAVVQTGTPLMQIGDPADLELVVDVLSNDAVGIRPGAAAELHRWGGEAVLRGQVRLVEPAAFTKVSALGVEEQRVNVIIDIMDPPDARRGLGDGFRVEARVVIWESSDVLKVPTAALFRRGASWAVFVMENGRAFRRDVAIGRRNESEAHVQEGLRAGDRVIVYPGDRIGDGVRVIPRGR